MSLPCVGGDDEGEEVAKMSVFVIVRYGGVDVQL
jgi:hypothetical protein